MSDPTEELWAELEECMSMADWNEQSRENLRNLVRAALQQTVHTWKATATGGQEPQALDSGDIWEMGPTQQETTLCKYCGSPMVMYCGGHCDNDE